jgi:diguanylate cyclase (GGDEF)-like protein
MSQAEKLPKNQPAEVHVDGIPLFAGEISALLDQGLLMSDARPTRGKQTDSTFNVPVGSKGELIFQQLFDDDGVQLIAQITILGADGNDVRMEFRDLVSVSTGEIITKLKAKPSNIAQGDTTATTKILPELRKRALKQVDKIFNHFLMVLVDDLFDLSGRPQQGQQQDELYEAMNVFKRSNEDIRKAFAMQIETFFDEPLASTDDGISASSEGEEPGTSELNLVDIQDFEDSLSLNRMVIMGQEKYGTALECLTVRFAELVEQSPLETRLPVDVAQLCQAFQVSLAEKAIPQTIAPKVYALFSQEVIRKLDSYYTSLNAYLRDQGIQVDLEEDISKHGSLLKRLDKKKTKSQEPAAESPPEPDADTGEASDAAEAAAQPSPAEAQALQEEAKQAGLGGPGADAIKQQYNPDDLYRSVIEALNFRRDSAAGEAAAGTGSGAAGGNEKAAGSSALANALTALQGDSKVRTQLDQQDSPSVRQYLSDNQDNLAALAGTEGISPDSQNQLDLVDNLFSDFSTEVDVTPDLKGPVGDLQIPLAKLALLEPQFFANREHPARGVIDKVAQLSSSGNYPNKALEKRVGGIIDNIVENYQTDSSVFESALGELDKLTDQQQAALERNVERVVKTQDGQQKLRKAKAAVDKIISSRIRAPQAPKPIVDLVDSGWRDLLTLTHVKHGPNSKAWKDYVKTMDLLSLWLIEKQKGGVTEQVQVERALEAEPFIDMIRQQISEALPSNLGHEKVLDELLDVLSGRSELEQAEVDAPATDSAAAPADIRKKVDTLPRLRRWVKRVEDLEKGNWLSFSDEDGTRKRMQLAWISEDRDRYIFVNERGQKVAEMNGVELARHLSRGVKAPSSREDLPLVDQSMYKTLEHVQKSLSFDKNHDNLTQLINRETFLKQLDVALTHAKSKQAEHALLYLDIDNFALVNEVYDELTGDQILVEFAKLLSQQHDKKTSSARLEGNKFGVLLLDRSLEQAIVHAEAIRCDIENSPVTVESDKISFTVSIGVSAILDHSKSVEEAMEHAEHALSDAKQEGRNKVVLFREDQGRAGEYKSEEAAVIADIEKTLDTKNFVLQAQPIARANPGPGQTVIEHYEVLLAMQDEEGNLTSPQDFIISAERFGYMSQVDRWVVKQVFIWMCAMMDDQKVVPNLAINLSGNSITDDNFMEYLFEQISEYGVGTNNLCFEITETGTISNMVKATDFVNEFRNIGCKFSIDDFGTGLASYAYLRELPVDYVKIDGTFIKNIHENPKDYAMTKSINDLAHFLGQETIAEFVENDEIIEKLREIGIDYLQGWGVGKPTPLTELAKELESVEK